MRRWAPWALGAVGLVAVLVVAVAVGWHRPPTHSDPVAAVAPPSSPSNTEAAAPPAPPAAAPSFPVAPSPPDAAAAQEREASLKQAVEQHLKDNSPNPAGVEDCIDLGVLYLDQNKVSDAEALFARMDQRRPPSAYHYVGRLGLAVTDALKNDYRGSHDKFTELFDPKSRDNRRANPQRLPEDEARVCEVGG